MLSQYFVSNFYEESTPMDISYLPRAYLPSNRGQTGSLYWAHGLIYLPNDRTQSFYLMGHFKTQAKVESQSSLSNFIILATNYKLNLILEIISNKILWK